MAHYGEGYDTLDDAAEAALQFIERQPRANKIEYMGLLIQDPDTKKFYRTELQTQDKLNTSEFHGYTDYPVVGIVHNHPITPTSRRKYEDTDFSTADVYNAHKINEKNGGVPSYINVMGIGNRVYRPGVTKTYHIEDAKGPYGNKQAHGDEFLADVPIKEIVDSINRRVTQSNMSSDMKAAILNHVNTQNPQLGLLGQPVQSGY